MAAPLSRPLLACCFFASGVTGLIYEIVWTRRLQLVFGSTGYSVTTVLAAFMAGLGIGSYLIGRRVDRRPDGGLRTYAMLEAGIGIYALLALPALSAVEWLFTLLQRALELGQGGAVLIKFALAFPLLALPAGMMGGTLPALARAVVHQRRSLHRDVGWLYGVNTVGAATGTLLAGLVLLEQIGLWRSTILAAAINLGIALVLLALLRRTRTRPTEEPANAPPAAHARLRDHLRRPAVLFGAVAVVTTGMLSMSYELIWTRLLTSMLGSSSYAFTVVLAIFLVGIGGGALLYARRGGRQPSAYGLALLLLALALWVALSLALIPRLPELLLRLARAPETSFWWLLGYEGLFAAALLLVPTLIFGAALPLAMGVVARAIGEVGRDVGGVYLANTAGAIAGSVITGFLLIPQLGTRLALISGWLLNLALAGCGLWVFARDGRRRLVGAAALLLVGLSGLLQQPWPPHVLDAGLGTRLTRSAKAGDDRELLRALRRSPSRLLFLREGVNATITVRRFKEGETLLINGKADASSHSDMTSQTLLGALPLALHPAPRDISVIGWGSGVTAHVATLWPGVRQVEAIEIERAVVEAAGFFRRVNGGVVDDRRLRVVYDDARSRLRTASQRFDVIISQPSNPWMVGNADLFTREHYALVKQRLRHGGVFAQWVQLYRIDARSLAAILRTLLGAFSHVQLWQSDHADVLVLASREPLRPSLQRLRRVLSRTPRLRSYLAAWGPGGRAANLLGCYLLGRASLEAVLERFPGDDLTDDRPLLEHRAVRALYQPTHEHLHALYRAKVQRGDLQPPTRAGAAPLGPLIEGALRVIRGDLALAARFSRWAAARHRALPAVRLARAKVLLRRRRLAEAEKLARSLPTRAPWPARAALLRARLALAAGRPRAALAALQRMGQFRPTARRFYQLRAALAAGSLDSGWTVAARLLRGLGDGADPDALQLRRDPLLGREIAQLIRRSRDWRRGLALLQLLPADGAGSYRALVLRLELLDHLGRRRAAAETLDQLRRYGLLERGLLRSCERTYRRAGRSADAAWCAKRARRLLPAVGPPLWRAPAKSGLLTRE